MKLLRIDTHLNLVMSRRFYLITKRVDEDTDFASAVDAVNNIATEHPEWDMEEERTWQEWETRQ